ncbi:MAG TPA: hypothetical protein VGJ60_25520 [Chloroflexota bacterium]|jgi:hypothetical protein
MNQTAANLCAVCHLDEDSQRFADDSLDRVGKRCSWISTLADAAPCNVPVWSYMCDARTSKAEPWPGAIHVFELLAADLDNLERPRHVTADDARAIVKKVS